MPYTFTDEDRRRGGKGRAKSLTSEEISAIGRLGMDIRYGRVKKKQKVTKGQQDGTPDNQSEVSVRSVTQTRQ